MGALTGLTSKTTEFGGDYRVVSFYNVLMSSASDTITLTEAEHRISEIQNVMVCNNAGQDAAFTAVAASFSGLVVTITAVEQDGTEATAWIDTTVNVLVIGK